MKTLSIFLFLMGFNLQATEAPFYEKIFAANAAKRKSQNPKKRSSDLNQKAWQGLSFGVSTGGTQGQAKFAAMQKKYNSKSVRKQMLEILNAYRNEQGLKAVQFNKTLDRAALIHAKDLAAYDRISHYGSDRSTPYDRAARVGYKMALIAENVGVGQESFVEVMEGWKQSKGHNMNLLLSDAKEIGLALVVDHRTEFKTFWVLMLGRQLRD